MKSGLEIWHPLELHHCRKIVHADVATTRTLIRAFTRASIVDALRNADVARLGHCGCSYRCVYFHEAMTIKFSLCSDLSQN